MITVVGGKGAPGASTVALLLAVLTQSVVVEADPAGGDLALRLPGPQGQGLPASPSIAQLAVDAAAGPVGERLWCHALQTAPGVPVVCGLPGAARMAELLREYARPIAAALAGAPDVVVDAGRLAPDSPALPFAAAAEVVVLVLPDAAAAWFQARENLPGLLAAVGSGAVRGAVVTAVVAEHRRGATAARELAAVLADRGLPVRSGGFVAAEPKTLRRWLGGDRMVARSTLLSSARPLVEVVAAERARVAAARTAASNGAPAARLAGARG